MNEDENLEEAMRDLREGRTYIMDCRCDKQFSVCHECHVKDVEKWVILAANDTLRELQDWIGKLHTHRYKLARKKYLNSTKQREFSRGECKAYLKILSGINKRLKSDKDGSN